MMVTDITADVRAEFRIPSEKQTLQKLQRVAMDGDWEVANAIFSSEPHLKTAGLNSTGMTALHVASRCAKSRFVVKVVRVLDQSDLLKIDQQGRTALHYVASAASVEAAEAMVSKEPQLLEQEDVYGYTPLFYAATWRHPSKAKEMVEYLHRLTNHVHVYKSDSDRAFNHIVSITASGCHALALKDLRRYPELATAVNVFGWSILHVIASQPSSSLLSAANKLPTCSRSCISSWMMNILCQKHKQTDEDKKDSIKLIHFVCEELQQNRYEISMEYFLGYSDLLDPLLHTAIKNGVYELVQISLIYFPELIWYSAGKDEKLLLHVAVEYRQEKIFNHIMDLIGGNIEVYSKANAGGEDSENILHLAAKLAPAHQHHSVPGPAFQMQKELQWFKAVENLVYKDEKVGKNKEGMTPVEYFFKEHDGLIKDAKEWMKDTSNSCMVIAALVATVAFASMITVPGGTNNNTGLPVLSNRVQFVIFSASNALSMISSAIALLVFLSIQTSRYTEQDFMESLPNNLLTGLFALFVAVATMMIAFALAIGMALHTGVNWAYIPITLVACIPAIIFTRLQLPLLVQTLKFASGPGISKTKKNQKLCLKKNVAHRCLNLPV